MQARQEGGNGSVNFWPFSKMFVERKPKKNGFYGYPQVFLSLLPLGHLFGTKHVVLAGQEGSSKICPSSKTFVDLEP